MRKRQKILLFFATPAMWLSYDNRPYLYVNRKQIIGNSEEELFDKLYTLFYGAENYTLEDVFPEWLRFKRDNTPIDAKSLRIYIQEWNKYFVGQPIIKKKVTELESNDFVSLYRAWTAKRQLTPRLFSNLKSIVNGIYSYCIQELRTVKNNPSKNIDMRQFPTKPVRNEEDVFTISDREKLLKQLEDKTDIYSLCMRLAFYITIRFAEISHLKFKDVKGDRLYINGQYLLTTSMNDDLSFEENRYENVDHVKGYQREGYRYILLVPEAQKIIELVRKYHPPRSDDDYIFRRMVDGEEKQLSISTFNSKIKKNAG